MPIVDILLAVGFRGGVENVINMTAKYLNTNGFHVRIVNLLWLGYDWADESLEFYPLIDASSPVQISDDFLAKTYLEFMQKEGAPDITITTGWPKLVSIAKKAMETSSQSKPIVSWLHSTIEEYISADLGSYKDLALADAHFCINNKIAEKINSNIIGSKTYVVTNPIDNSKLVYSEDRDKYKLAYVGRFSHEKNIPFLLSSLSKADKIWSLEIVGDGNPDGSTMNAFKAYCKELGISDRVTFHGWLDNPWEVLKDCKALALTSNTEASPLVIVEALLCGMFVISTPTEGSVEKIHPGENGFLIPFGDEDFFVKVLSMIKNKQLPIITPQACRKSMEFLLDDSVLDDFRKKLIEVIERT